ALVFWNELGRQRALSHAELRREVARYARALAASGVQPGDRVAGYLPNLPETVIATLASASHGATWSSRSPDFGARAVLDRFGQIRPRVLFAADGYRYAGKVIDLSERVARIAAALPETETVVVVPYLDGSAVRRFEIPGPKSRLVGLDAWLASAEATNPRTAEPPNRFPFDHPLYIVYSSGTTGLPKCIVHGAGGTLLQHLKELVLHTDLTRDDRIFYFTTCGW